MADGASVGGIVALDDDCDDENRKYKTGARSQRIQPNTFNNEILSWEMARGVYSPTGEPWDDCAPTISVAVAVRLGQVLNADRTITPFPDGPNVDWSAAKLLVRWGTSSGNLDTAAMECDLVDGMSFTLNARGATFAIDYGPPVAFAQGLVQPVIDVSISVAIGTGGHSDSAFMCRRTVTVGATAAGAPSGLFSIPPFSSSAIYQSESIAGASATFNQTMSAIAGSATVAQDTIQKQLSQAVPIAHGARGFSITTPADTTRSAVIFLLAPT